MWAVGLALILLVSSVATARWAGKQRPSGLPPLWNIPLVVANYTQISSTLAALSLASVVFIATIGQDSPAFEDSIGLFLFSVIRLVSASMQFAATPHPLGDGLERRTQNYGYVTANGSFYLGIAVSWLGLRLLLLSIHQDHLADIFTWVLLFAIVMGGSRLCMHLYKHTSINGMACLMIPALGVAYASGYWFGIATLWSGFLPAGNQPLYFSIVAFVLAGVGYGFHTLLLALQGERPWEDAVTIHGEAFLATHVQCTITVVMLIWLSVAEI